MKTTIYLPMTAMRVQWDPTASFGSIEPLNDTPARLAFLPGEIGQNNPCLLAGTLSCHDTAPPAPLVVKDGMLIDAGTRRRSASDGRQDQSACG